MNPYTPESGYAFRISRRYPRDPATIIVGDDDCATAKFVGHCRIDDRSHRAFRCTVDGKRCYIFQVAL